MTSRRTETCPDCGATVTLRRHEGGSEEVSPDGQGLRSSPGWWELVSGGCTCAAHASALREDAERAEHAARRVEADAALREHAAIGAAARTDDPRWVADGDHWITVAALAIAALDAGQPKPRCAPTGVQEMGGSIRPWHPRSVGVPAPVGDETFPDLRFRSAWMVAARAARDGV